jgi:hypothetical protein
VSDSQLAQCHGSQVMLISHQWAGRRHPDPKFEQFSVLQKAGWQIFFFPGIEFVALVGKSKQNGKGVSLNHKLLMHQHGMTRIE